MRKKSKYALPTIILKYEVWHQEVEISELSLLLSKWHQEVESKFNNKDVTS